MSEVIERCKSELAYEYEPVLQQMKEEAQAKDEFYRREMDKSHKVFEDKHSDLLE